MGTIQVEPKAGAYVDQWVAVQFLAEEGILPVKKLLKGSPWSILEAALLGSTEAFVVLIRGTEVWRVNHGDWVVKTPHDKVWFMGEAEFASQFHLWSES